MKATRFYQRVTIHRRYHIHHTRRMLTTYALDGESSYAATTYALDGESSFPKTPIVQQCPHRYE